jgi:uncharacterized membrane protein YidH (DUF202 family)
MVLNTYRLCIKFGGGFRKFSSTVLNKGSTARDHLANERTFLAWGRTGLGFVGAGTGLFTAYSLNSSPNTISSADVVPSCLMLIMNGGVFVGFSLWRYVNIQEALKAGNFIITRAGTIGVVFGTMCTTCVSLWMIYDLEMQLRVKKVELNGRGKDERN